MKRREIEYEKRFTVLYVAIGIMAFLLIGRLFSLQIINGAEYKQITATRLVKTQPQQAPRGEILDRYGRPMVSNRMGYTITLTSIGQSNEEINKTVFELVKICEKEDQSYNDGLPITYEKPFNYTYYGTEREKQSSIENFLKSIEIKDVKSPENLIDKLCEKFEIDDSYSYEDKRKIAGVRTEMQLKLFSRNNPYNFARDVDMEAVTKIKETADRLNGVNISVEYLRKYNQPGIGSHILGRTGIIFKEEYEKLIEEGYTINDIIGKDGIEKYCEKILRGKDGTNNIEEDDQGHIISSVSTVSAVPGNDVVLTIDAALQEETERALADAFNEIRSKATEANGYEGIDCNSGSAVVIDVDTGEILALASAPTFDLESFNKDYEVNYNNPHKPMWNRAVSGTYEPGSIFKMVTALAGLETGVITTNTTVECTGRYMYYAPDYMPYCWNHAGHGITNVESAIKHSCNCFFFETGRLLTIEKLNEYTKKLGLGDYTGIELAGEEKGIVAGPEYVKTIGEKWWPGDTIQAAIGQSKNLFTPIQMANYIATLANGGTRYRPHLIKKVKEYSSSLVIDETEPEIIDKISMSDEFYRAIMNGMKSVTEDGTASAVFADCEITVGGKTGTAEVANGSPNGVFVAFAPFENPQIAMAIVVEHGAHGINAAPVARRIIEKYFSGNSAEYSDGRVQMQLLK